MHAKMTSTARKVARRHIGISACNVNYSNVVDELDVSPTLNETCEASVKATMYCRLCHDVVGLRKSSDILRGTVALHELPNPMLISRTSGEARMKTDGSAESIRRKILTLFEQRGDSLYGGEGVTQIQHALQAAQLAEQASAAPATIIASLLHDVGHLLHNLPDDAPDQGIDDLHEELGNRWLQRWFVPAVCEPVRLHVASKRYLCAVEPEYETALSEPSRQSLALQGGPMSADEVADFESNKFYRDCVAVRRWDDLAKDPTAATPSLE